MTIYDERNRAVARTIDGIRSLTEKVTVGPDTLEAVKGLLLDLAEPRLFPLADFPVTEADGTGVIYRLSEDADHRYALYASVGTPGKNVPPHDHTTWAVIAGIEGTEVNRLYARDDDGSEPGRARIHETGEVSIGPGKAVAFMPDDIHSIHCFTDQPTLNFHLYGRSIEHLPERKMFNMKDGTCAVFPANPKIHK